MTTLETCKDIQWLFDTALKTINRPAWVKFAVLHGNEDCPSNRFYKEPKVS